MENIKKIMEEKLGNDGVIDLAIEEMSELTKALLKYKRACKGEGSEKDAVNNVAEEYADVQYCLEMIADIFGAKDETFTTNVEKIKEEKTQRSKKRYCSFNYSEEKNSGDAEDYLLGIINNFLAEARTNKDIYDFAEKIRVFLEENISRFTDQKEIDTIAFLLLFDVQTRIQALLALQLHLNKRVIRKGYNFAELVMLAKKVAAELKSKQDVNSITFYKLLQELLNTVPMQYDKIEDTTARAMMVLNNDKTI